MSTRTSTSSRKRKADDGSASSPSRRKLKVADATTSAAHLPAPCLAAILNFMEYADVRRCLLAGTIMAVDAARHVEVLNIMNASELMPSAARRFANVTEVNILSLVTPTDGGTLFHTLSVGTATRSIPFLTTFPKLQSAFLGGIYWVAADEKWKKNSYVHSHCLEPKDHLAVFRGLVDHLCGAFQTRSLNPSLHLKGVVKGGQLACEKEDDPCRHCLNITTSFPLALVLEKIPERRSFGLCLNYFERIEALVTRHDTPLIFQPQAAIKCFLTLAKKMFKTGYVHSGGDLDFSFVERMESQGGEIDEWEYGCYVKFGYITVEDMKALKRFATAMGPSVMSSIPKHELLSTLPMCGVTKNGKKRVLVRQTFEDLVQLGLDLASKDFILVDPLTEVALRNYHHMFHSEEEAS